MPWTPQVNGNAYWFPFTLNHFPAVPVLKTSYAFWKLGTFETSSTVGMPSWM